jgi:hypothetical protein
MSPATLAPPPAKDTVQAPPPVAQSGMPPSLPPVRAPLSRARQGERGVRVSRLAVAVSVAAHLGLAALLVLGLSEARRRARAADARDQAATEQVSYLDVGEWPAGAPAAGGGQASATGVSPEQAVTAAAIDSAIARTARDLRRFPERVPTRIPPAPTGGAGARGGAPAGAPGAQPGNGAGNGQGTGAGNGIGNDVAGGRYGAGYGDRRLIVPAQPVPERVRSDHERYMEHLNDRLATYNDSVAEEAEHQRRIHNWTVKDRSGREWGIGEGGVPVIAGRKIPVPLAPPIYVDRDQENAQRQRTRQRAEIDRQVESAERGRSVRESAQRARERADAERRRRREATNDST